MLTLAVFLRVALVVVVCPTLVPGAIAFVAISACSSFLPSLGSAMASTCYPISCLGSIGLLMLDV